MPTYLMPFEHPTLKLADTEAGLATGDAFECQLTTAELTATVNMLTVEQTPCQPSSQIPQRASWALHIVMFQDWPNPGGLSAYAKEHQGQRVWFELVADSTAGVGAEVTATGEVWVSAGPLGGIVSAQPVKADLTWPCPDEPTITTPAPAAAAAAE